jgi:Heparinase II/III-like protein/Heparinase II/III N-terminus
MREGWWRGRVAVERRRERAELAELAARPVRLLPEFQKLSSSDLLKHFRTRDSPRFLPGFAVPPSAQLQNAFPAYRRQVIEAAWLIARERRWPLLGFGLEEFGDPSPHPDFPRADPGPVNWHRDPLSGRIWPLDYHADITLRHDDGSDVRVLWELNRLGHLITLGCAYALTDQEEFAAEFYAEVESWQEQNPPGRGANWSCAMEVALRAMNLLAAFSLFRSSPSLNDERLAQLLLMFDQHGAHIRRNLEFSYVATSNHYLSDVIGLLWIGILLPELAAASEWRGWALAEMLRELDKQVLADGAYYEGSTGYHRFVLELFLYSFVLCRANEIPIADKHWRKLQAMFGYLKAILRPDGAAPLVGDTDGGQVLPIVSRHADDHAYLLALGAAVFKDSQFKPAWLAPPPELPWILGTSGLQDYEQLAAAPGKVSSQAFPDAGLYVLRHDDLYLLFNAGGPQQGRPASHRHNDSLGLEVSACGSAFIVDPGSYVYTADLRERQLFRSTAYHSTVQLDQAEQNTICEATPFVIGTEAIVNVLSWETTPELDRAVAEHARANRLAGPVRHQRTVTFYKPERWWLIEDEITGAGTHEVAVRFHFAAGLDVKQSDGGRLVARDESNGVQLLVVSLDLNQPAKLTAQFTSRHYGMKLPSVSASWTAQLTLPAKFGWAIVPVGNAEEPERRLNQLQIRNLNSGT